jgi:hypothetical protein
LYAALRYGANDRRALELLCWHLARSALAHERLRPHAAGQVAFRLKTAWRDGTKHQFMVPLVFMHRLADLVSEPRLHLIRLVSA